MRFGYNDKKTETATVGGDEILSSILVRDGIVLKAKAPVTVYLQGMLTQPDLSVILPASRDIADQAKPKKKQFEIR